jgi:C_GCAxxG_C_C family probable redox protein
LNKLINIIQNKLFCQKTHNGEYLFMTKKEEALGCFNSGFSCSQSVLSVYAKDFGLSPELALKIACPFSGGISHTSGICGAVSGALMVIGLKYGRYTIEDVQAKEKTFELVQILMNKFKERFNSTNCTELLGYDLSKPEEFAKVKESGITRQLCPKFVGDSIDILEEIL